MLSLSSERTEWPTRSVSAANFVEQFILVIVKESRTVVYCTVTVYIKSTCILMLQTDTVHTLDTTKNC